MHIILNAKYDHKSQSTSKTLKTMSGHSFVVLQKKISNCRGTVMYYVSINSQLLHNSTKIACDKDCNR